MTTVDLILGIVMAFTTIGGFMFEWRRLNHRDERHAALDAKVASIDARLGVVETWRDRVARTW